MCGHNDDNVSEHFLKYKDLFEVWSLFLANH